MTRTQTASTENQNDDDLCEAHEERIEKLKALQNHLEEDRETRRKRFLTLQKSLTKEHESLRGDLVCFIVSSTCWSVRIDINWIL